MPNGLISSYSVKIFDLKTNAAITYTNTGNGTQRRFMKTNLGINIWLTSSG